MSVQINQSIEQLLEIAVAHHTAGRYSEAGELYRYVLHTQPNHPVALQLMSEVVSSYKKALTINQNSSEIHNNLGVALQELGEIVAAKESYQKAIEIEPSYSEAHYNLANLLQNTGNPIEAIDQFRKAIEFNHDFSNAHNNLGVLLRNVGKLREALKSLKEAVKRNSNYPEAQNNLGLVYQDMGNQNYAITSFQKALSVNPDYLNVYSNMTFCLQSMYHDVIANQQDIRIIRKIIKDLPNPIERKIVDFQFNNLRGENTLNDWVNIVGSMPTSDSETIKNPIVKTSPLRNSTGNKTSLEVVAILHFGRSGSGFLHSLLDDHPNISTTPGIYMNGFFGRGVWSRISNKGYKEIPKEFSHLYDVLFDARSFQEIPPAFISDTYNKKSVGELEGFLKMGPNKDTPLTLSRTNFIKNLTECLEDMNEINQGRFFEAVHFAYEKTLGNDYLSKNLIIYHIHKMDAYSMANFLKYFPDARLILVIRNPLQSIESWALRSLQQIKENTYKAYQSIAHKISSMLMILNSPTFKVQSSVGLCLENIKENPKNTMRLLSLYLGVKETQTLYNSTMQGLKWWGDPSSSLFGKTQTDFDEKNDPTKQTIGILFHPLDQFILNTLFYPLRTRFGYIKENHSQFKMDLKEIGLLIKKPLAFEKALAKKFEHEYPDLEETDAFKFLHSALIGSWQILNEYGYYPNMINRIEV